LIIYYVLFLLGWIHRDLNPKNILLTSDNTIKISDFGIAKFQAVDASCGGDGKKEVHSPAGTFMFWSPEQLASKNYTNKIDIFALGLILFTMLFPKTNFEKEFDDIRKGNIPQYFGPKEFIELFKALVAQNPNERPAAVKIVSECKATKPGQASTPRVVPYAKQSSSQ